MFIKKFFERSEMSGDIFFKAGENVTEVNFVIILLNAKKYLFSFSATVSSVEIYLNRTKRGKNWFNLSCIVFLWSTLKLSCSILSSNQ